MTGRKECRLSLWGLESSAAGDVKFDKVVIPEESSVRVTLRKHSRTQAKLHKPAKFEWEILHVSLTTGPKLFCTYFRLWFAILPQLKHCCLCLYFSSFLSHFLCSFSVFRQLPPHSSKMWNTHPKKSISSCLWILIVSFFLTSWLWNWCISLVQTFRPSDLQEKSSKRHDNCCIWP